MRYLNKTSIWIYLAVLLTFGALVLYTAVQQSWRQGANLPQDAMAQDIAQELDSGKKPTDLVTGYVDMSTNLAPFIIIYDQFGKVVIGNGYLDSTIPQVPVGVLAAAKGHGINSVTWQPKANVRIASVSVQAGDYYVLGGRSLQAVENKIDSFGLLLVFTWLGSLFGLFLAHKVVVKHPTK